MKTLPRPLRALVVLVIAIGAGVISTVAMAAVLSALLPPFRREDDDTLRQFIPVAILYATMAATTLFVAVLMWRRSRAPSSMESRDIPRR